MDHTEVKVDLRDNMVGLVVVDRPPHNFIDLPLVKLIADSFEKLEEDGCRAIVLASEGRHFCAGADFGGSGSAQPISPEGARDFYREAARLLAGPLPVVACVQGAAVGGGAGLALAADFRISTPSTRFWMNFSRLGIHQGFAISVTLPRIVGPTRAMELLLSGRPCYGTEAERIGLCDRLVSEQELLDAGLELATSIASSAPLAVRSIRKTQRGTLHAEAVAAMDHEFAEQLRLRATDDHQEGMRAIAERRPPNFTGR